MKAVVATSAPDPGVVALQRIGAVLGALYAHHLAELEIGERINRLETLGFSLEEVGGLLGMKYQAVWIAKRRSQRGRRSGARTARRTT